MNLHEKLFTLKDSNLSYVCLEGHRTISNINLNNANSLSGHEQQFSILTNRASSVIQVLDAEELPGEAAKRNFKFRYQVQVDGIEKPIPFRIFEKGNNLFPERFESELLNSRVIREDIVHVPDNDSEFWALMYMRIIHQGALSGVAENDRHMGNGRADLLWRDVMIDKLSQRVGPFPKPKYAVGFYPGKIAS